LVDEGFVGGHAEGFDVASLSSTSAFPFFFPLAGNSEPTLPAPRPQQGGRRH